MEWKVIEELLDPQLGIVLVVCWILGGMLKVTPHVPNWSIVYIVTGIAILLAVMLLGNSTLSYLQGFLCGAVAVYGYELVKQGARGVQSNEGDR
ncbi:phage holin family protein [Paenibacillus daejeonensis]|uniref:phage holin family protein n=1 Tax=Paenibacillus daejeonensis TaxID=135193 RepID=UPI00036976E5|nr:phage holin family protein [Paenibacillus daejeonensis]